MKGIGPLRRSVFAGEYNFSAEVEAVDAQSTQMNRAREREASIV